MRFGVDKWIEEDMDDIRLFAIRSVWSRLSRGKFPSATIELSVKSIASCWSYIWSKRSLTSACNARAATLPYLGNTKVFDSRDFIACEPVCERLDRDRIVTHLEGQVAVP